MAKESPCARLDEIPGGARADTPGVPERGDRAQGHGQGEGRLRSRAPLRHPQPPKREEEAGRLDLAK